MVSVEVKFPVRYCEVMCGFLEIEFVHSGNAEHLVRKEVRRMKKIIKGWLSPDNTVYCMTDDGMLLMAQTHFSLKPAEAELLSMMIEKENPVAGGDEVSGVNAD